MVPKIEDGNNFGVGIQVAFHCWKEGEYTGKLSSYSKFYVEG